MGRRSRHLRVVMTVFGIVVAAGGLFASIWCRDPSRQIRGEKRIPEPPSVTATDLDPAVLRAVEAARATVLQSPRSAEAWGKLGMVLSAHELATEANACFLQAEQLDLREPRWPYFQGIELSQRAPEQGAEKLQRAIELFGGSADAARLRLGELLLRQGRLDEAEAQFRLLLQWQTDHARAHLDLARLALDRGDLHASLDHLSPCASDQRTQKASCVLAAEIYQRLGDPAAADQQRQRAAQLPEDLVWPDPAMDEILRLRTGKQVRLARADRLLSAGDYASALAHLRGIVHDYPESDWGWLLMGRAFLARKELPAAEAALRKAAKLADASIEVQFYLGVVLLLEDDPRSAAGCFRRAIEIKADFAEAHHNLGHCLLRQGDRQGAVEEFRKAVDCKPNYGDAHRDLGELLTKNGQVAEALVHLRYACRLNPAEQRGKKLLEQVLAQIAIPAGP
ncbi:MAG TPA: tetratricopeptide repeat protein [Gemmataceae bacterium]|nr:tetratricopeptide repeat protein [Gemmataceae bacterium]